MQYVIDPEIFARVPDFVRTVVVARNVVNGATTAPALEAALARGRSRGRA